MKEKESRCTEWVGESGKSKREGGEMLIERCNVGQD